AEESLIDERLEKEMAFVKKVVSLALSARKRKSLKVRQPLARIMIHSENGVKPSVEISEIILQELNIKKIEYIEEAGDFLTYNAKPIFASLGPKVGKSMGQVAGIIKNLTTDEIKRFLSQGRFTISLDDRQLDLTGEEIEVVREEKEGFAVESDGGVTVALDTERTPELIDEGFAREVVNKVQNMRKTSGFEVTDRILVRLFADEPLAGAVDRFEKYIRTETLADSLERVGLNQAGGGTEWNINGEKAVISVARTKRPGGAE
ncbi:MAG: isoleucine--tRNA ligase, partial [Candidatus Margulisbacteria bacterium]|nr:isoleucine--tRNA ligase [Candidatus Margulisiibacteriota bacterium]